MDKNLSSIEAHVQVFNYLRFSYPLKWIFLWLHGVSYTLKCIAQSVEFLIILCWLKVCICVCYWVHQLGKFKHSQKFNFKWQIPWPWYMYIRCTHVGTASSYDTYSSLSHSFSFFLFTRTPFYLCQDWNHSAAVSSSLPLSLQISLPPLSLPPSLPLFSSLSSPPFPLLSWGISTTASEHLRPENPVERRPSLLLSNLSLQMQLRMW